MLSQRLVKIHFAQHLPKIAWPVWCTPRPQKQLPRRHPKFHRPNTCARPRGRHKNIRPCAPGSINNILRPAHIDRFAKGVFELRPVRRHNNGRSVEDSQRKMCNRGRPRLGEHLLGRQGRRDIRLDKVAVARLGRFVKHVLLRKGLKVNDSDARGQLAALEKLED